MKNQAESGGPPVITMKRIQTTAARLPRDGELTTASFRELHRERGVRFHESYIRKLPHGIDFTSKLPDTVHAQAASDEECDRRYGKTMKEIEHYRRRGFAISV